MSTERINIVSTAEGAVALLSNFAHTPFTLDGVPCASVEGFIQGLKCESPEKQLRICARHGYEAKRAGTRKRNQKVRRLQTVWWRGEPIEFRSEAYYQLVLRAIRQKFASNEAASAALSGTGSAQLVHETGKPEKPGTSLPAQRFVEMLTEIRLELQEVEPTDQRVDDV